MRRVWGPVTAFLCVKESVCRSFLWACRIPTLPKEIDTAYMTRFGGLKCTTPTFSRMLGSEERMRGTPSRPVSVYTRKNNTVHVAGLSWLFLFCCPPRPYPATPHHRIRGDSSSFRWPR
ncbi:unnamed protein product [Ectocarpus sp. 12 AP-2014]